MKLEKVPHGQAGFLVISVHGDRDTHERGNGMVTATGAPQGRQGQSRCGVSTPPATGAPQSSV